MCVERIERLKKPKIDSMRLIWRAALRGPDFQPGDVVLRKSIPTWTFAKAPTWNCGDCLRNVLNVLTHPPHIAFQLIGSWTTPPQLRRQASRSMVGVITGVAMIGRERQA